MQKGRKRREGTEGKFRFFEEAVGERLEIMVPILYWRGDWREYS
jgi:hypothetical protein